MAEAQARHQIARILSRMVARIAEEVRREIAGKPIDVDALAEAIEQAAQKVANEEAPAFEQVARDQHRAGVRAVIQAGIEGYWIARSS